jgi:hypothetical protein
MALDPGAQSRIFRGKALSDAVYIAAVNERQRRKTWSHSLSGAAAQ